MPDPYAIELHNKPATFVSRQPVSHFWFQQCLKYLERFVKLDDGRLVKAAFLADRQLGLGWYQGISDCLRLEGIRLPRHFDSANFRDIARSFKDKAITRAMSPVHDNHLELNYFKIKVHFRCEPYISQSKNLHLRKLLAMFRTGSHWLMICKGRHQHPPLPYHQRLCPSCRCLDDEQHAIFDCGAFAPVRSQFVDLFKHGTCLTAFFTKNPVHRLALFLTACRAISPNRLATLPSLTPPQFQVDLDIFSDGTPDIDTYDSD